MRLVDLSPQFLHTSPNDQHGWVHRYVESLAEADGVMFDCPGCSKHRLVIWFTNAPKGAHPEARWNASGTGYEDLTVRPSINASGSPGYCPGWHGWIKNGEVTGVATNAALEGGEG